MKVPIHLESLFPIFYDGSQWIMMVAADISIPFIFPRSAITTTTLFLEAAVVRGWERFTLVIVGRSGGP